MGNPFVLDNVNNDEAREAACDAYRDLLNCAMMGLFIAGKEALVRFGRVRGHTGRVKTWDGRAAAHEVRRLMHVSTVRDVHLRCNCAPRRCHGHEVAQIILFEQAWDRVTPCPPKAPPSPWL